jgi:Protein of unknown function (DUF1360)
VEERPPYRAYVALVGTFVAGLGAVGGFASRRRQAVPEPRALDLALLGLATFKASRTLARDKVASFVREPFVEGPAYDGRDEVPVHDGEFRQAIGELVTCTRCVGTWVGASLASLTLLAPRTGRLLTTVLAAGALNDWLQAGFAAITAGPKPAEASLSYGEGRERPVRATKGEP